MFKLETVNEETLRVTSLDGMGTLYTKAGAMISYNGECNFEKVLLGPEQNDMKAFLGQLGRRLTGENIPLMKVNASNGSQSFYADKGQHVLVINLEKGMELKVESENLLAFTDDCKYSFKFLGQGLISQKGMFTTVLSAMGPNAQVAILTTGNPIMLDTPCYADPDAIVAWTGYDPDVHLDVGWKNLIGQSSGESYSFRFLQPGGKVIVQPFERRPNEV